MTTAEDIARVLQAAGLTCIVLNATEQAPKCERCELMPQEGRFCLLGQLTAALCLRCLRCWETDEEVRSCSHDLANAEARVSVAIEFAGRSGAGCTYQLDTAFAARDEAQLRAQQLADNWLQERPGVGA